MLFISVAGIIIHPISAAILLAIMVVFILLLMSAFISGSEVAFFGLSTVEKEYFKAKKNNNTVSQLLKTPKRLLVTLLIANNFVNVAIIVISTYITGLLFDFSQAPALGLILQVAAIVFLILFFGEIIPNAYASQNALKFAKMAARPLALTVKIVSPFSFLLLKTTSAFDGKLKGKQTAISMDEISQALEFTSDNFSEDKELLKGIASFGVIEAKEIMKSRVDIIGVDIAMAFSDLYPILIESAYSRVPVFSESIDNIVGILYLKDLIPYLKETKFDWTILVRPPYFIPGTKKINDLLKEFQSKKNHMAIVVDEYGGTYGIITLKDILDEILGEIKDELDDEDAEYTIVNSDNFIFEGKTLLNDFYKIANLPDEPLDEVRGEAETLAGLILEMKGDMPLQGEKLKYKNITFKITAIDSRRIKRIHVYIKRETS